MAVPPLARRSLPCRVLPAECFPPSVLCLAEDDPRPAWPRRYPSRCASFVSLRVIRFASEMLAELSVPRYKVVTIWKTV